MKFLLSFTLLFFLIVGRLTAQSADSATCSLISYTDYELEQDSLQASSDVMVPFRSELLKAAHRHQVPAALLAAFCQEESGFNPWAERSEPKYWKNARIKRESVRWSRSHGGLPSATTELSDRAKSMGLMQPMGEVAREQGYDSTYLSSLFEPFNSIEQGAILLKKLLTKYGRDTLAAISAYNQGSPRQAHGTFANARYVYRVAAAWRHYQTILYATYFKPEEDRRMARRDCYRTLDTGSAAEPALQHRYDSSSIAQIKGDADGIGPLAAGYDLGTRYGGSGGILEGEGKQVPGFEYADSFFWAGFCLVAVSLLGLIALVARYDRARTGYDFDLPG